MSEADMTPLFDAFKNGEVSEEEINNAYKYVEEFLDKCEKDKKLRVLTMDIDKQLEVAKEIADEKTTVDNGNFVIYRRS